MPYFDNKNYFKSKHDEEFAKVDEVSTPAPVSGIYRCTLCGHEIVIVKGKKLPPDGDHGLSSKSQKHYEDTAFKNPSLLTGNWWLLQYIVKAV